jgi:hypothetical protein
MSNRKEISGKSVRDEIKLLIVKLISNEYEYDSLSIRSKGVSTLQKKETIFTSLRLKQSEITYIVERFSKYAKSKWDYGEFHEEGDGEYFGKTYRFTKRKNENKP